jgi:hypothetical protein
MSRFRLAFWVLLLPFMAMTAGCDAVLDAALSQSDAMAAKEQAKEDDQMIDAALKGGTEEGTICVPMSEFFANPQKYKLWAGDPKAFQSLGEKCTAAGAPAVYAMPSKEDGMCDSFAIALPTDKAARAKVFEAYNQFWKDAIKVPASSPNASEDEQDAVDIANEELEYYLANDFGQKYIFFAHDN